ncbi:hypothetical protein F8A10_12120 [Paracoccus kondratievae]|uniref:hypothetical protein n=1 Tax=Paracoccus kondratievae TaxID=135740 RepID=UPI0012668049|nr:hypothetical protein [Paracoccus kondratievae]QFQ88256.1 hypothetical protein F8A10_12120 [Paracoccus kondratievae]
MSARSTIIDLRRDARAVAGLGLTGVPIRETMQRAADVLERVLDEYQLLRAYADLPQEDA